MSNGPNMTVHVDGIAAVNARLQKLAKDFPDLAVRALTPELYAIFAISQKRCPRKTGALRRSGSVRKPRFAGRKLIGEIGYNMNYAAKVHENMSPNVAWTTPGTGPKYLEQPVYEYLPFLVKGMEARIMAHLKGA